MEQTSLRGIANKAVQDKTYRFRNLFGLLTVGFLFGCWEFINKKASAGVDRIDAQLYEENLIGNIEQLVEQVKENTYRTKLVLRKYIPKLGGKLRPLGIPAIADKLLQLAVAKILEAIYEQYKHIAVDRFTSVVMRMILFVLLSMKKMRSVSTKP